MDRLRPLKRWTWVGVFGPELMLCAGDARVAGLPLRWWALALPDGSISQRTTFRRGGVEVSPQRLRVAARDVQIDVELGDGEPIEVRSPSGRSWIWTRKRAGVPARGSVDGRALEAEGFVDESAGHHERHTKWKWSAGVGRAESGERVAWNLVTGIHDAPEGSERTVWVDGEPTEVGPVRFADDLSRVAGLVFTPWAERVHNANLLVLRTRYRAPFGTFVGELPGGLRLAEGYGVMEDHDAHW
jgi:hypothetical protein